MIGKMAMSRALEGRLDAPVWARCALAALAPAGVVYGKMMQLRRWLYENDYFERKSLNAPVISVGNLTLGGTGKTPTVAWIAERLLAAGHRPAVVSRGYGEMASGVTVVGDGRGGCLSCPPAADEAVMLARNFPNVPVITGRARPPAARMAVDIFGATAVILDDGFQHVALQRNMDLVTLRGEDLFGNGRVFPSGALREPAAVLGRASAVLLTGEVMPENRRAIERAIGDLDVYCGSLLVDALLDGEGKAAENPGDLAGSGVVAVSGIARPESFAKTLARIGVRVLAHEIFPDHARYTDSDADRIISSRAKTRADFIVATEKDAVKLSPFMATETFRFLRVKMKIDRPEDLTARILAAVEMSRGKMNP